MQRDHLWGRCTVRPLHDPCAILINFVGTNHEVVSDLDVIVVSLDDTTIFPYAFDGDRFKGNDRCRGGPGVADGGPYKYWELHPTGRRPLDAIK